MTLDAIKRKFDFKKSRSKRRKIDFALTFEQFTSLVKTEICAYTGIKMTRPTDHYPISTDFTLDRIDSSKGYIPGNVVACSWIANNRKSFWERDGIGIESFEEAKRLLSERTEELYQGLDKSGS